MTELCEWQDLGEVLVESQHNAVIIGTLFGSENKKIIGDDNRHDLARSIGGSSSLPWRRSRLARFPIKFRRIQFYELFVVATAKLLI